MNGTNTLANNSYWKIFQMISSKYFIDRVDNSEHLHKYLCRYIAWNRFVCACAWPSVVNTSEQTNRPSQPSHQSVFYHWNSQPWLQLTIYQVNNCKDCLHKRKCIVIMSDDDMGEDYPDFVQIKSSPSTSPRSLPSRENSVILEARDVAGHSLGE